MIYLYRRNKTGICIDRVYGHDGIVELPETLFESGLEMQHLQMLRLKFIKMGMPTSEDLGWSLEDYSRITAIPVNRLLNFSFIHQEVMRFWDFHLPVNGPA